MPRSPTCLRPRRAMRRWLKRWPPRPPRSMPAVSSCTSWWPDSGSGRPREPEARAPAATVVEASVFRRPLPLLSNRFSTQEKSPPKRACVRARPVRPACDVMHRYQPSQGPAGRGRLGRGRPWSRSSKPRRRNPSNGNPKTRFLRRQTFARQCSC